MYVFISLEVELLCQMTTPCLTFLRTCQTFSKWLHHFTISLAVPEDPSFSASSPRLVPVYLLYGCEALSHCDSDLHVPNDIKQLFMWLVAICVSSLEDCLFKSSAHFWDICLLLLSCKSSLYALDTNVLHVTYKYFLPAVFHFLDGSVDKVPNFKCWFPINFFNGAFGVCTGFCVNVSFHFTGMNAQEDNCSAVCSIFSFIRNRPTVS